MVAAWRTHALDADAVGAIATVESARNARTWAIARQIVVMTRGRKRTQPATIAPPVTLAKAVNADAAGAAVAVAMTAVRAWTRPVTPSWHRKA